MWNQFFADMLCFQIPGIFPEKKWIRNWREGVFLLVSDITTAIHTLCACWSAVGCLRKHWNSFVWPSPSRPKWRVPLIKDNHVCFVIDVLEYNVFNFMFMHSYRRFSSKTVEVCLNHWFLSSWTLPVTFQGKWFRNSERIKLVSERNCMIY